jgi:hypothetical protein
MILMWLNLPNVKPIKAAARFWPCISHCFSELESPKLFSDLVWYLVFDLVRNLCDKSLRRSSVLLYFFSVVESQGCVTKASGGHWGRKHPEDSFSYMG